MREQRARRERMPYILIEGVYENEQEATGRRLRMQAYQAVLLGAAGHVFGNNPIWISTARAFTRRPSSGRRRSTARDRAASPTWPL
jgi:hypothetical protein